MNTLSGTNIAAINAISNGNYAHKKISSSLERLSSGTRVNSYGDNITTGLAHTSANSQIGAISSDVQNVNETLSMLRIADKALEDQIRILNKVRAKAVQASSDGLNKRDRSALQNEIRLLFDDLDDIAQQTTYKGKKLLTGEYKNKNISLGSKTNEQYRYSIDSSQSDDIGYVRYETTNGGSRNIDNLSLNFKEIGSNKEDVRLDPFILSSTAGRTLKDLANHVNASSNRLGGVRAIYKEGIAPTKIDAKRVDTYKKLLNNKTTTSFYEEKDFEYVDYSKKVKKIEGVTPIRRENFTFKSPTMDVVETSLPTEKGSETLVSPVSKKDNSLPISSLETKEVVLDRDIPYSPVFRAGPAITGPGNGAKYDASFGVGTLLWLPVGGHTGNLTSPEALSVLASAHDGSLANGTSFNGFNSSIVYEFKVPYKSGKADFYNIAGDPSVPSRRGKDSKIIFYNNNVEVHRATLSESDATNATGATPYTTSPADDVVFDKVIYQNAPRTNGIHNHAASGWRDFRVFGTPVPETTTTVTNGPFEEIAASNDGHIGNKIKVQLGSKVEGRSVTADISGVYAPPDLTSASVILIDRGGPGKDTIHNFTAVNSTNQSSPVGTTGITIKWSAGNKFEIISGGDEAFGFTLSGATGTAFKGDTSRSFPNNLKVTPINLPAGLGFNYTLGKDFKTLDVELTSFATDHYKRDSINDFELAFRGAFDVGTPANAKNIEVKFIDPTFGPTATLVGGPFKEKANNEGFIDNTATIRLGDDLIGVTTPGGIQTILNKDVGPYITHLSDTVIINGTEYPITGATTVGGLKSFTAAGYDIAYNTNNLTFPKITISNTLGLTSFKFKYSTATTPELIGDFSPYTGVTAPAVITDLDINHLNLPAGLTPIYTLLNPSEVLVKLDGDADPHKVPNGTTDLTFKFEGVFSSGKLINPIVDAVVEFIDPVPPTAKIRPIFKERIDNKGFIGNSAIITLGDDLTKTYKHTAKNGLGTTLIRIRNIKFGTNPTETKDFIYGTEYDIIIDTVAYKMIIGVETASTKPFVILDKPIPWDMVVSMSAGTVTPNNIQRKTTSTITAPTITASNLPAKLEAAYVVLNSSQVEVTLNKDANNHVDDIDNLEFSFSGSFSGGVAPKTIADASIDFLRDPPIAKIRPIFKEKMPENLGAIGNTATINLGDDIKAIHRYKHKDSLGLGTLVHTLKFGANATMRGPFALNTDYDYTTIGGDVYTIRLGENHTGDGKTYVQTDKELPVALMPIRFGTRATEGVDGTATFNKHSITKTNPTITTKNLPIGFTPAYTFPNTSEVIVTLNRNANALDHENRHDVKTLEFSFRGDFSGRVAPASITNASIDFEDAPVQATITPNTFSEKIINDGSIRDSRPVIDLGDKIINDRGLIDGDYNASRVSHGDRVLIDGVTYSFNEQMDFPTVSSTTFVKDGITYGVGFKVVALNNVYVINGGGTLRGSTVQIVDSTTFGERATGPLHNIPSDPRALIVTSPNLPSGLSISYTLRGNKQEVEVQLTGNASKHIVDRHDLIFSFAGTFSRGVPSKAVTGVSIDYISPILTINHHQFSERIENNGEISNVLTLNLSQGQFVTTIDGKISLIGVPDNLVRVFDRKNASNIEVRLTKMAINNTTRDNLDTVGKYLKFDFEDDLIAFNLEDLNAHDLKAPDGSDVREKIEVLFLDSPPGIAKFESSFSETLINKGTIKNRVTIDLGDKVDVATFVPDFQGIPDGLALSYSFLPGNTKILVQLSGEAVSHRASASIDDLTFSFSGDFSTGVHPVTAKDGKIEFIDPILSVDRLSFTERAKNDGKIDIALNLIVTNAVFNDTADKNIILRGVPNGLEATFELTSLSNIQVNLIGRAISHQFLDSLNNLFFDFADTNIRNNVPDINLIHINTDLPLLLSNSNKVVTKNIEITFEDNRRPRTTISGIFSEVDRNDGTIRKELTINLDDDYYSKPMVTTDLRTKAPGLSARFTHINTSQIVVQLVGAAIDHRDEDDVDLLNFTFTGGEFSSGFPALTIDDASIDFLDPALEIDGDTFSESFTRAGIIETTLNLHVTFGVFADDIFEKISLTDVPAGLKANFHRESDTDIQITLQDIALSHADEDDSDGLRNPFLHLNFRNSLIKLNKTNLNSLPVAFNGADVKDSLIVDFLDGSASLKTTTFTESELENDGSISNTITLSFDTDIVDTINNADITLNRLPDNLTVSYVVRQAEREIIVSLSGQALKHTNSDDVDDLFFSFTRNVLKNGVQMDNLSGVSIDFFEMDIIPNSTTFYESRADIGSIKTIINLSITGNKVKDGIGFNALQDLISASSLPHTLSAVFRQVNASNIEVRLINEALLHDTTQNITNLTFSFAHTLFETPTKHQTVDNMHIDFFTRPSIEIDPTDVFSEQEDDVGNIDNAITFKLSGDRFSSIGNNKLEDYIEVKNVPDNLSVAYRLISPQKIEVTLKGNALSHENIDDVDNLLFSFDSAIVVNNSTISELQAKIDFFDIPILLANEKFVESVKNDGSIRKATTINIVEGTQFSNIANQARWDELISIDNLPNNLSARYELVADSNNLKLEVSLINNALFHGNSNDVDNLVFNFNREAFKGGVYNIKANSAIDFYDEPLITLSPSLVESFDNDGSIGNEAIFLLKGDTWNVKEDFSYANIAFSADLLEIEKIIVDGVDILNNRNPMSLSDVVQQMGYNTNGVGVTTNNGKHATIYAAKDGGSLVFYSNEIEAGDSINVKFKLEGYGFDNIDLLKDNPAINHSFGGVGSIDPKDVSRYVTSSKIPVGLSPSFTYIDSTRIKVKLEGNTPEAKQIDVRALFSFDSILLNYGIPANEASGLVDFIDRATLSLDSYTFSESRVDQGKVDTVIELSALGDGFIDEKTAIDGGYFHINGLPNNLIASFAVGVADDDKINVTLSGVAVSHKITDNLTNLSLRINPLAFSSTLNAINDKGESSNIIENISLTFLEEVIITADDKSFFESFGNDGSIRNKITFDIEGGSELKQVEKTLKYGFSIDLANAKGDGFIVIDGKRFDDFDSSDSLQVIAKKLSNSLNNGGVGSFIHEEIIYGKTSGSFLLILKERSDGVVVGGRLGNNTILPSPSLSIKDKTVKLNDLSFNINDNISFNLADFSGLVPNFTPLSPTQIVMELNGVALSHTKADLSLNIDVEFSSGLFEILPSNFNATNKPRQKVNILFLDTATLTISGKFKETNKNKGEIDNITDAVTVKFTNDKIVSGLSNDAISRYVTINNLPAGLTPSYLVHANKAELIINLDNKALSHDIVDSVDSIEVVFDKDMFVSKSSFEPIKNVELDFIESSIITASPITFQEAESNTGLIANALTLTVENGLISSPVGGHTGITLDNLINLINVPTGLKAEYSYIDNKHIEVILSSTIAGGVNGAVKHSPADDLHNLRFEFENKLLNNDYLIEDIRDVSIDFGTNINIVALNNVFSEEFYSNNGFIDRTITLEVQGGDIKNNIKNFSFASRIDDIILRDIAENGLLKIDNIDLADKTQGRYYIDNKIRDFTTGTAKEQSEKRAYHIASVINNGYEGTALANGDKLFANVVENGATYEVYLLKNTTTSVMLDTFKITNSFANDNTANPSVRAMVMPDKDSNLDGYAAYINVPLGLTPKFKALTKNLIEVELRGNAFSHLVIEDDHNKAKGNQLEFNFSPHAFIDALYVSHAGGIDVSFVDNKINNEVSFLEADFIPGTISAPYVITFDNGVLNPGLNLDINISADNVPEGLIPTYSYVTGANNKLEISFKGKVDIEHRPEHNVDDLTFHFNRALFDEDAGSATTRGVGKITYINQPILEYAPTVIREKPTNAGHMQQTINIHISDGTLDDGLKDYFGNFVDARLTSLISAGVPLGLGTSWHIVNSSNIQLTLEGFAISHTSDDSSGIRYDFNDIGIMKGSVVADDISYNTVTKDGIYLSFVGQNTFKDMGDFIEVDENTGAISNTLNIEISTGGGIANKYYTGKALGTNDAGENLITVENLPTGLTPTFARGAGEIIIVSLNGIASKRDKSDSTDINFTFHNDLMSLGLASDVISNVDIKFIDVVGLSFNQNKFVEHSDNNGTFKSAVNPFGKVTITLSDGELSNRGHDTDTMEKRLQDNIVVDNLDGLGGLSVSFKYIDNTHVEVHLRGITPSHKSPDHDLDNVNGLTFSFKSLLIKDEIKVNLSEPIAVDFINQAELAIVATNIFSELDTTNIGDIEHTGNVKIRSTNDVNFVNNIAQVNANVSYINLPEGLTAEFEFTGIGFSNLVVKLNGRANDHTNNHDVDNLQFEFKSGAFNDSIATTTPDFKIDFKDNVKINAINGFIESVDNDGSIANRVTLRLGGDTLFDLTKDSDAIARSTNIIGLPNGLIPTYRIISPKEMEIELTRNAVNIEHKAINSGTLVLKFINNDLFNGGTQAEEANIDLTFLDAPKIELIDNDANFGKFKESNDNDGSIKNNITFRISNGTIDEGVDINSLITPINMSPNYDASFQKINASTIVAKLSGKSILNDVKDSSSDLEFSFDGGIFNTGIKPDNLKGIHIDYIDAGRVRVNGVEPGVHFRENGLNNGRVDSRYKVTITLENDTFVGNDIGGVFSTTYNINSFIKMSNIDISMNVNAEIVDSTHLVLSLFGAVDPGKHHPSDSIDNVGLTFLDRNIFTSNIIPKPVNNIKLDFIDYESASIEGKFHESNFNDGSVLEKVTISLESGLFSKVDNIKNSIVATGIPQGLSVSYEIALNSQDLVVTLDGKAINHTGTSDTDITFSFIDKGLFTKDIISDDLKTRITFSDRSTMSVTGKILEEKKNTGSVGNSAIRVVIIGDKFKENLSVANISLNLPDGLKAESIVISGDRNIADITFSGNAISHEVTDNKELTLALGNNMFRNGRAPDPVGGIPLEFLDSPTIDVTGQLMENSKDDGSVDGELNLELDGDTYNLVTTLRNVIEIKYQSGPNDPVEDYKPIQSRLGLTPIYSLDSANLLKISFEGTALNHEEGAKKIRITFDEDLFTNGIVPTPIDAVIEFIKKPELSYVKILQEAPENDGSFNQEIVINVDEGELSALTALQLKDVMSMTLPQGLSAEYRSDPVEKKLYIKINGNAVSHLPLDSIGDVPLHIGKGVFKNNVELDLDDIALVFVDAPIVKYDKVFNESILDDGSITNTVTLAFEGGKISNSARLDADIEVKNIPYGLVASFKKQSENILLMSLEKDKSADPALIKHTTADSATLEVSFKPEIFQNLTPPVAITDLRVLFKNTPTLESPTYVFTEKEINNGSIENKITLELKGDEIVPDINLNTFLESENVPIGLNLNASIDNNDGTKIILSLEGKARDHKDLDDIKETDRIGRAMTVRFSNSMFTNGVSPQIIKLGLDFIDVESFTVDDVFHESTNNDGSIIRPIVLRLPEGVTMRNINPSTLITVENLPDGLTPGYQILDNTMQITLGSNANIHKISDSVDNLIFSFAKELFVNNQRVAPVVTKVIYTGAPSVSINEYFQENNAKVNDGTINNATTITIQNDTFKKNVNLNDLITLVGVPDGLTPKFTYINPKTIIFELEGRAKNHLAKDGRDIEISFDRNLFQHEIALIREAEEGAPIPTFDLKVQVSFDSVLPPLITHNDDFFEDTQNDGSIVNSIFITTENGDFSDNYKFKSAILIDDLAGFIGVRGNFNNKSFLEIDGHKIEDIDLSLNEFDLYKTIEEKINNLGKGINGLYAQVIVDDNFRRKLVIVKNKISREVEIKGPTGLIQTLDNFWNTDDPQFADGGRIDNGVFVSRLLPLKDVLSEAITVSNLPKGLVPRFVLKDKVTVQMFLDESALIHSENNNVDNLTLSFDKSMFKKNIQPLDINNIKVNFQDPGMNAFGEFTESKKNDGTISNYVTLVLRGDELVENVNFAEYIEVINIPKGLKPVFIQESSTILRVGLEGRAEEHEDQNDVSNMSFNFKADMFKRGVTPKSVEGVVVNFDNAPDPASIAGGPGVFGGYLTFISPNGKNISIVTDSQDFGLDQQEFQATTNLGSVIRAAYGADDTRALGYTKDPIIAENDGGYGFGMASTFGSSLVIDSVDSAISQLTNIRQNISSNYNRIEKRINFLSTEKLNIDSANSSLKDVNFAEETTEFNKRNILSKSGNFVLTQASNMQKEQILNLIKNTTI